MKNTEQDADMADAQDDQDDYEEKLKFLNAIAKPIANKKLAKRLFKCIKKGTFNNYLKPLNKYFINFFFLKMLISFCSQNIYSSGS